MKPRTTCALAISLATGVWFGGAVRATAQEEPVAERRNAIYAELGGCSFSTVNYERGLWRNASLRVGVGVVPLIGGPSLVVMPSLAFGGQRHRFSAGFGLLAVADVGVEPTGEIAYRMQRDVGFVFRASIGVLEGYGGPVPGVMFSPGVSVGWSF